MTREELEEAARAYVMEHNLASPWIDTLADFAAPLLARARREARAEAIEDSALVCGAMLPLYNARGIKNALDLAATRIRALARGEGQTGKPKATDAPIWQANRPQQRAQREEGTMETPKLQTAEGPVRVVFDESPSPQYLAAYAAVVRAQALKEARAAYRACMDDVADRREAWNHAQEAISPRQPSPAQEAEPDVFEKVAREWANTRDAKLPDVLRDRFGPVVEALERLEKALAYANVGMHRTTVECLLPVVRAALSRLRAAGGGGK